MAWADSLRPASFRGVPFLIEPGPQPIERGRRLDRVEYPGRDIPGGQDQGRKGRTISYTAFVIGPDAMAQAKRLIDACEGQLGTGTLVDPWRGEMTVGCSECTDSYDSAMRDVVSFRLVFFEMAAPAYPAASKSPVTAMDAAAVIGKTAALADFTRNFSFNGVASFVAEAAQDLLGEASSVFGDALGGITAGPAAAIWARTLSQFAVDAADIIRDPASLAQRVYGLMDLGSISGLADIVQFPLTVRGVIQSFIDDDGTRVAASWKSYLPLITWLPSPRVAYSTPSASRQAANQTAFAALVRQGAAIEASRAAVRNAATDAAAISSGAAATVFASRDEVIAARETLADHIVGIQETAGDETFRALRSVRVEMVQALTALAPVLPRLQTLTPVMTSPAIIVAWAAFGDDPLTAVSKADDLVARNGVPDPLFVSADPLQVLAV